jgi:hypothetical protein
MVFDGDFSIVWSSFVRKRRGTQTPEARVVIVNAACQEAQVDYGASPMVRDPESRKSRRTRPFVTTPGWLKDLPMASNERKTRLTQRIYWTNLISAGLKR